MRHDIIYGDLGVVGSCVGSSCVESAEVIDEALDELGGDTLLVFYDIFAVEGLNKVGKDLWHFFIMLVGIIKFF